MRVSSFTCIVGYEEANNKIGFFVKDSIHLQSTKNLLCSLSSFLFEFMYAYIPDVVSVFSSARSICLLGIDKQ